MAFNLSVKNLQIFKRISSGTNLLIYFLKILIILSTRDHRLFASLIPLLKVKSIQTDRKQGIQTDRNVLSIELLVTLLHIDPKSF